MNSLADAIVFAVSYIDSAPDPREERLDDDVRALESIADYLSRASSQELDALAAAAIRQAADARKMHDHEAAAKLDTWMEDMCGDSWVGNVRASS